MDQKNRETLDLIQQALDEMLELKQISVDDYCRQMVYVVNDYLVDKDYKTAIKLLTKIDSGFLSSLGIYKDGLTDFSRKAYFLYIELGIEFCIPTLSGECN